MNTFVAKRLAIGFAIVLGMALAPLSYAAAPPTLSSVSPTSGPAAGGTTVTLSGSNFVSGATVKFGGSNATSVTVVSATTIRAVTPAGSGGTVDVTVTNPDSQSATLSGTQQPLTNPGFESGSTGWVAAGSGTASVLTNPSGAHSGSHYVQVSVSPPSSQLNFFALLNGSSQYLAVNPGDVITFGGWAYRVSGDGRARWGIEISDANQSHPSYMNAPPANVTAAAWQQQQGTYTVPAGEAFIRFYCQITLNTVTAQANFDDAVLQRSIAGGGFTYIAGPAITSVTPSSGTSNGGTFITIHGSGFISGATATVGGLALGNVTVVNSSTITGNTQAHVAGGADVAVTSGGQTATLPATLYNQGFEAGSTQWKFAGSGSGSIVDNVLNAHDGTYYAELSAPNAGNHPLYYAADSSGNPVYFPVNPGDMITYGGWGYRVSGDGKARWSIELTDSSKSHPQYLSAPPADAPDPIWTLQQRTYTVPSGIAYIRLYAEIVNNTTAAVARFDDAFLERSPGGSDGYTYISPPFVNSVAPNWGTPDGGTTRTVYGTGFDSGATVKVGGVSATNIVVNSHNAITFFVPPHSAGAAAAEVINSNGDSDTLANAYTYKTAPAPPAGLTSVHHIVFTFQENRSFDNYFGMMNQYRAMNGVNDNAVDGLNLNTKLQDLAGQPISPFHLQTVCHENTQPSWNASHVDYDNGLMDDFLKTGNYFSAPSTIDPNGTRAIGYYDWTDLPYYYALAFQFATSDRFFSSAMGPTGTNRAYTFAATSLGFVSTPQPPNGGYFSNFTIFDLLDRAGVSWRYYYQQSSPSWINMWSTYANDSNKIVPISQYYTDVEDESTFPQVVFIEENGNKDEHPKPNPGTNGLTESIQDGASLMSKILGALMASPSWKSSIYIQAYDEGGGMYDHVPPPSMPAPDGYAPYLASTDQHGLFDHAGFRVPLLVVSPWTIPHLVSHVARDHTSILKLIEVRFGLPPLTARDDAADNMMEFFNFQSPAWMTPPTLPTQPTNGDCDLNLGKAPGQ